MTIHLENGKRLDSYDEIKGEIVSRKATDLESIELSTFESYLKEMKNKYSAGIKIETTNKLKFYFHFSLKYGLVEVIMYWECINNKDIWGGGTFAGICKKNRNC